MRSCARRMPSQPSVLWQEFRRRRLLCQRARGLVFRYSIFCCSSHLESTLLGPGDTKIRVDKKSFCWLRLRSTVASKLIRHLSAPLPTTYGILHPSTTLLSMSVDTYIRLSVEEVRSDQNAYVAVVVKEGYVAPFGQQICRFLPKCPQRCTAAK